MRNWDYAFGVPLPSSIQQKLDLSGLVRPSNPNAETSGFEKDAFTPDGYPVYPEPYVIYPALLYKTIGIPIAETLTQISDDYRQKAALAALKWLEKVLGSGSLHWTFCGLRFQYDVQGQCLDFCFPDTTVLFDEDGTVHHYAVLAFPDSRENDADWEKGMIPQYAESQAQLMLWCSQRYAELHPDYLPVEGAFVVRIKGNISADVTVRSIQYNPRRTQQLLVKLSRASKSCLAQGCTMHENLVTIPKTEWREEKQQDLDNAYHIDSPDFYNLISDYMKARSIRKNLEAEAEEIKAQMATIAFTLSSLIQPGFASAEVDGPGVVYSVAHTAKRKNAAKISPDLLRQLAPEHIDAIHVNTTPRGRITIEVL